MKGLVNAFYPPLSFVDHLLTAIGFNAAIRIGIWSVLSGVLVIGLYGICSKQRAIKAKKRRLVALRARLSTLQDVEFAEVLNLSWLNVRHSFSLLGMVLVPTLISALPVMVIITWLNLFYTYQPPISKTMVIDLLPASENFRVIPEVQAHKLKEGQYEVDLTSVKPFRFLDQAGTIYEGIPFKPAIAEVDTWHWWNVFLGNEAGYLRADSQVRKIIFHFEKYRIFQGTPDWMATWQFVYFAGLMMTACCLKIYFKLE